MNFINSLLKNELIWFPKYGFGYRSPNTSPLAIYDKAYFEMYLERDASIIGVELTECRINLVKQFEPKPTQLLDVGVGGGAFVKAAQKFGWSVCGYDINPQAVKWLLEQGLYRDIEYLTRDWVVTFWDSLEHIQQPWNYLYTVKSYAFISMPIYRDSDHVLTSKHYKPDEHLWYFTHKGLVNFMEYHNFYFIHRSNVEIQLGREDVWQYVFLRREQ